MDEHFEWKTGHAFKDASDEQTSFNEEIIPQSATVSAQIKDLEERRLHNFRELMRVGLVPC
ncbi:hypothetical protein GGP46_003045 [Salinibacter ruber]|jgi:hypothetical protein|nr:hypothetical protein [Salinibacter ruber]